MNTSRYQIKHFFSIRTIFLIFPLMFVLLVLIPTGYLLAKGTIESSEEQIYERLVLENERVGLHLKQVFSTVQHINRINAVNVENGNLNYQSQESLTNYFLSQVQEYKFISSIYFGIAAGGLANAGFDPGDDGFYVIETESFIAGDFIKYAVDENGERTSVLVSVPDYDARSRGWYQLAEEKGDAIWTDIYQLFTDSQTQPSM